MYTSVPQAPAGVCTCTWVGFHVILLWATDDSIGQRRGRVVLYVGVSPWKVPYSNSLL